MLHVQRNFLYVHIAPWVVLVINIIAINIIRIIVTRIERLTYNLDNGFIGRKQSIIALNDGNLLLANGIAIDLFILFQFVYSCSLIPIEYGSRTALSYITVIIRLI